MDGEPLVPFVEDINKKVLSVLTQVSCDVWPFVQS